MARVNQVVFRAGTPASRRPGFTLVEVLLVLAILAMFATLFIPGVTSILREMDARGPEQIVSETVLAARGAALESGRTVTLHYDAEARRFLADAPFVPTEALPAGLKVELLPPETGATVLLGGQLVETGELQRVRFFPDGTCDPFRVRMQEGTTAPRLLQADPWTCALSPVAAKR
jgi:general secretion pathway protein H